MPIESLVSMRELDYRLVNGLDVQLWRDSETGCICVSVRDARTESQSVIKVRGGERPLDVFHHPFAYARRQRLVAVLARPHPRARAARRVADWVRFPERSAAAVGC